MSLIARPSKSSLRGDTLIEVSFAIAVFALVSLLSITIMNTGVTMAESSLESTMTRNEIDAQAEALRFIQNSYLSEIELVPSEQYYRDLWNALTSQAITNTTDLDRLNANFVDGAGDISTCSSVYTDGTLSGLKAFALNTRNINPSNVSGTVYTLSSHPSDFAPAELQPRVIFTNGTTNNADELSETSYYDRIQRVEGIWIIAVKSDNVSDPEFYDFHIRTCWYAPGKDNPSTIATIIRLYNPNFGVN